MKISIEDFCEDIVGKAMRGRGVSAEALARAAQCSTVALKALLDGQGDEETARAVAPHLGLDAEKLADSLLGRWYPESHRVEGLFMTNTPYHDMFVNAYLIWSAADLQGAVFDTGADAGELIEKARELGVQLAHIFLTHTHRDHIMDLARVQKAFPQAPVHVGARELLPGASPVNPGDRFNVGPLTIHARLTFGHSDGGMTYVVEGLSQPVAVVGDAVFAGSMGGGMVSYEDALRTNREEILTLSEETILCPGHGPLTTVGEEKRHNPFY